MEALPALSSSALISMAIAKWMQICLFGQFALHP